MIVPLPLPAATVAGPGYSEAETHLAAEEAQAPAVAVQAIQTISTAPAVPFYSQLADISSPKWKQLGCGITDLAMVIDFYRPDAVSVDKLLKQGIKAGAYKKGVGWSYDGLIRLAKQYGLAGSFHDLSKLDSQTAFAEFENFLKDGPVILSVHNRFNPKNKVPHLVVITGIDGNIVSYNDPAASHGGKTVSIEQFLENWKKKLIVIRPLSETNNAALSLNSN